jgi:hypothetical protein
VWPQRPTTRGLEVLDWLAGMHRAELANSGPQLRKLLHRLAHAIDAA